MFGANNPNLPAGVVSPTRTYSANEYYQFISSRYSEKVLNSVNCSNPENVLQYFSDVEQNVGIIASNMSDPNKLEDGTDMQIKTIDLRFMLRTVGAATGITSAQWRKFQEFVWRCVYNVFPDQRSSIGRFKMARHFPVITGAAEASVSSAGLVAAGAVQANPANQFQGINLTIDIPWQSRVTLKGSLTAPIWEDETTDILSCIIYSGEEVQGPART